MEMRRSVCHCKHGYDGGCTRSFDDRTAAMVDGNTSAMGVSVNVPFVPYSVGDGFVTMVKVFLLVVLYEGPLSTKIFVST